MVIVAGVQGHTETLSEDLATLRAVVLEQRRELARKSAEIEHLQAQLNLLLAKRFAPSSEKVAPGQLRLFNEAEAARAEPPVLHVGRLLGARPTQVRRGTQGLRPGEDGLGRAGAAGARAHPRALPPRAAGP